MCEKTTFLLKSGNWMVCPGRGPGGGGLGQRRFQVMQHLARHPSRHGRKMKEVRLISQDAMSTLAVVVCKRFHSSKESTKGTGQPGIDIEDKSRRWRHQDIRTPSFLASPAH